MKFSKTRHTIEIFVLKFPRFQERQCVCCYITTLYSPRLLLLFPDAQSAMPCPIVPLCWPQRVHIKGGLILAVQTHISSLPFPCPTDQHPPRRVLRAPKHAPF